MTPPTAESSPAPVRLVPCTDGDTHAVMGDPMRFIMTAADSGGSYAICEQTVRPGNGAPPHIHHHEEEAFLVLDGEFDILIGDETKRLKRGDFAHVPRGLVRGFTNAGSSDGRMLILHVPGSASDFYIGMGKLPFPPDLADIKTLGDRYGIEIVMPKES